MKIYTPKNYKEMSNEESKLFSKCIWNVNTIGHDILEISFSENTKEIVFHLIDVNNMAKKQAFDYNGKELK